MSANNEPQIMTSPVFRYAVLVVLSVVVIMGAGVCYRTRVYQRRMYALAGGFPPRHPLAPSPAPDWGPKPTLFDVYLRETPPVEWDAIMPVSVARGDLDASGASSLARISVLISMPSPSPSPGSSAESTSSIPDDECEQYLEFGLSDMHVLLSAKTLALRSSSESDEASNTKGS
ncbi:hypothetical protein GGX14DRAFT_426928 [Mycena pura]|uniref:Transmembrane protein n=1 Tax=Mycena pura TaxID=153505 RepID=A0AAD6YLL4_9AGAR|nr:hypothetical protein GGX14DRAFT_426928 [Mycena pura]